MLVEVQNPAKPSSRTAPPQQQNLFYKLQSCNNVAKLTQIHAQILTNGFAQKNFLLAKLLYLYVAYGFAERALAVSGSVERPSTTVWNQIIRAHGRSEAPWRAVECFKQMAETDAEPDGFTYSYLLRACASFGSPRREGEQVHARVLANGHFSSVFVQTNLINLYAASAGDLRARRVFDEMPDRNVVAWNSLLKAHAAHGDLSRARRVFAGMPERSVVSWTTMVSGCARSGLWREALSLFRSMARTPETELDRVSLLAALSACAELGDLRSGRSIHDWVVATQQRHVSLHNALVHMYAGCGAIDDAVRVFEAISRRTTASWTTIIAGLAKQGRAGQALSVFRRMLRSSEPRPDEVTFLAALCACSRSGLVDEGRAIFDSMARDFGIEPRVKHYGCLVDLLSRAGLLDEAQSLIGAMPVEPGHAVWGALLNGCRLHGNAELGPRVARELLGQLDPCRAAGYLVLLSNVFAGARRWTDAARIRRAMVETGVRKPPGRSWVQIVGVCSRDSRLRCEPIGQGFDP